MRIVVMIAILLAASYLLDIPDSKHGMVTNIISVGFMWAFLGDILQYLHYIFGD